MTNPFASLSGGATPTPIYRAFAQKVSKMLKANLEFYR